jgi:hypothetical protein
MEQTPSPSKDVRTLVMVTHLSAFAGLIIPFGNIIAPLIIWLLKRDESPEINTHGKAILNFQITITLAIAAISLVLALTVILSFLSIIVGFVGAIILIWFTIKGAIKANEGTLIEYPFTYTFIK